METEKDINEKIMAITIVIQSEHPELAEHLTEMPVTIPNAEQPEINEKVLNDYYESLKNILKKYACK